MSIYLQRFRTSFAYLLERGKMLATQICQASWRLCCTRHGRQAIGKLVVVGVSGYGLLLTLLTYRSSNRNWEVDYSERAYIRLIDDLANANEQVRIGAISRIPHTMTLQVPLPDQPDSFGEALLSAFRLSPPRQQAYKEDVQRLVYLFVRRGKPMTPDEFTKHSKDPLPPAPMWIEEKAYRDAIGPRELIALIDMFDVLGPEEWYNGRPRGTTRDRRNCLRWLWEPSPNHGFNSSWNTVNLFEETTFAELDLERFRLPGISLQASRVLSGKFSYADLEGANLTLALLDDADFTHANLAKAKLMRTSLVRSRFAGADLRDTDFQQSDARDAVFRDSVLVLQRQLS